MVSQQIECIECSFVLRVQAEYFPRFTAVFIIKTLIPFLLPPIPISIKQPTRPFVYQHHLSSIYLSICLSVHMQTYFQITRSLFEFLSLTINSFLRKHQGISGPLGQNSGTVPQYFPHIFSSLVINMFWAKDPV